jgi:hypothetical protein
MQLLKEEIMELEEPEERIRESPFTNSELATSLFNLYLLQDEEE